MIVIMWWVLGEFGITLGVGNNLQGASLKILN
jgi:hypothetical protein